MASTNVEPTYLSSLFGGSLPTASATTTEAPQAGAYTANPYTSQASTVGTQGLGANALVQQIMQASQPVFQQQQHALTDNLANAGIVGGSSAGAGNDLATQQIQQLLGALVPVEQNATNTQLGADEYNASALTNNSQNNASALNNNSQFNANNLNNNAQFNTTNQVNANNTNAGILNQNSQYNTTNALNAGQNDAGASNTILSQLLSFQNQDYLQQLNNQLSLAQGQQSDVTNAYQPIYQQASAPSFSRLAGAFGSNSAGAGTGSTASTASNAIPSSFAQNFAN